MRGSAVLCAACGSFGSATPAGPTADASADALPGMDASSAMNDAAMAATDVPAAPCDANHLCAGSHACDQGTCVDVGCANPKKAIMLPLIGIDTATSDPDKFTYEGRSGLETVSEIDADGDKGFVSTNTYSRITFTHGSGALPPGAKDIQVVIRAVARRAGANASTSIQVNLLKGSGATAAQYPVEGAYTPYVRVLTDNPMDGGKPWTAADIDQIEPQIAFIIGADHQLRLTQVKFAICYD
jgi:hypothetical protein